MYAANLVFVPPQDLNKDGHTVKQWKLDKIFVTIPVKGNKIFEPWYRPVGEY